MCSKPQRAGSRKRIYSAVPPPAFLIAAAMNLTVMHSADGHRELVADLAAERAVSRKTQMMSVIRLTSADQAQQIVNGRDPGFVAARYD